MKNMRFKVGDRVRIKSLDWYNKNKSGRGFICFEHANFIPEMSRYCGEILTISQVVEEREHYLVSKCAFAWTDEMIEGLVEEEIIDLTSIVMETVEEKTIQNTLTYGYNLPEGYQFVDENGNVINATKIVLEKKKKEYPKTYEECIMQALQGAGYNRALLLTKLEKLLTCRDAYWKIAGEEMGLGKPWEPDWWDDDTKKYVITSTKIFETFGGLGYINYILTFPTKEMRDAFYENFKELIGQCKELL